MGLLSVIHKNELFLRVSYKNIFELKVSIIIVILNINLFSDHILKSQVRGYLYDKKYPDCSPVNQVPRFAGIFLIFFYMKSFVPVCRDEYATWYCFEFSSV